METPTKDKNPSKSASDRDSLSADSMAYARHSNDQVRSEAIGLRKAHDAEFLFYLSTKPTREGCTELLTDARAPTLHGLLEMYVDPAISPYDRASIREWMKSEYFYFDNDTKKLEASNLLSVAMYADEHVRFIVQIIWDKDTDILRDPHVIAMLSKFPSTSAGSA